MLPQKRGGLSNTRWLSQRPRKDVLSIPDETSLPGHLGVNKTCQKILDHFKWLSLRKVVA